jgi:hypothetical protein
MQTLTKIEQEVIKLVSRYKGLTIRRIHVMVTEADTYIAAKKAVERLNSKGMVTVNDELIVNMTSSFEKVLKKAYSQNGKSAPAKRELHQTDRHSPTSETPYVWGGDETLSACKVALTSPKPQKHHKPSPLLPRKPVKVKKESASPANVVEMTNSVDMVSIRENVSSLEAKHAYAANIPVIENASKRVDNLIYLSNILPHGVAAIVTDIANDIREFSETCKTI